MKKQKMTGLARWVGQSFDVRVHMFHEEGKHKEGGMVVMLHKLVMVMMIQMIIQTQATTHISMIDKVDGRIRYCN